MGKNKKFLLITILIILVILMIISVLIIYTKNTNNKMSKILKIGNNTNSQDIVDYILNIKSYEAEIDVEVKSNKNSNKYRLKQKYINKENNKQEVIEPNNISGLKLIREGNNLKIENTKLNIFKIIEDYKDISENNLDLNNFIEEYKVNSNSKFKEENNQIVMETILHNNNYQKYAKLYINKENGYPEKMEIKDANQNLIIYIIYSKIQIL